MNLARWAAQFLSEKIAPPAISPPFPAAPVESDLQSRAPAPTRRLCVLGELEGLSTPNPLLHGVEAPLTAELVEFSEGRLESELFGHVEGAFTDARTDRVGCFEPFPVRTRPILAPLESRPYVGPSNVMALGIPVPFFLIFLMPTSYGDGFLFGMPPNADTVLLMLSGGIESTYLLYHFLRDTAQRIHAHHVSIRYPHLQHWRAEDAACERIVPWCRRKLRDFEFSNSRFDLGFTRVGWDSDLQLVVASKVALNLGPGRIRVVFGWCADDFERPLVRERHERGVVENLWEGLRRSLPRLDLAEKISVPLVEDGIRKDEVIARLPSELLALTWSCRCPTTSDAEPRPCGSCHGCRSRSKAMRKVAGDARS